MQSAATYANFNSTRHYRVKPAPLKKAKPVGTDAPFLLKTISQDNALFKRTALAHTPYRMIHHVPALSKLEFSRNPTMQRSHSLSKVRTATNYSAPKLQILIEKQKTINKEIPERNKSISVYRNLSLKKTSAVHPNNFIFQCKTERSKTPSSNTKRFHFPQPNQITYTNWIGLSKPGLDMDKKSKQNQDCFTVIKEFMSIPGCLLALVCDGHGINGHIVSNHLCKSLPSI